MRRTLPPLATLRPFEAAARLGSFTAAADELALTQGAIRLSCRAAFSYHPHHQKIKGHRE